MIVNVKRNPFWIYFSTFSLSVFIRQAFVLKGYLVHKFYILNSYIIIYNY